MLRVSAVQPLRKLDAQYTVMAKTAPAHRLDNAAKATSSMYAQYTRMFWNRPAMVARWSSWEGSKGPTTHGFRVRSTYKTPAPLSLLSRGFSRVGHDML